MNKVADIIRNAKLNVTLRCTECDAAGLGSCDCGAPYVTPSERAEEAIKANPKKSNRAIAEEIGVSNQTVMRARKATAPRGAVEKRTGKDGKTRQMPKRPAPLPKPKSVKAVVIAPVVFRRIAAAGTLPFARQVNLMTEELSDYVGRWIEGAKVWAAEHREELDGEDEDKIGGTGKDCLMRTMNSMADELIRLAQALDGR